MTDTTEPPTPQPDTNPNEALHRLGERLTTITQQLTLLFQTTIQCAACVAETRQNQRPVANIANVIVGGEGLCHEHVDIAAGRLVRRNSSGLIVAGG